MPYDQLSEFLAALQDDGDLVRVAAEVDPVFELTEITQRIVRSTADGGPAVLFENVGGLLLPVVTNLLGHPRRLLKALDVESLDEAAARIAALLAPDVPDGWRESLRLVPRILQLSATPPRSVKTAACQQVVRMGRDVDLAELPAPQFWPGESGPTLTAGQVCLRPMDSAARKMERYPLELRGRDELVIHWTPYHDGWRMFEAYRAAGQQMPVAIAFGGDPLLTYAAGAPVPSELEELLLTGLLRGRGIDVVRARSVAIDVPAHAELVIEGYLDPAEAPVATSVVAAPTGFLSVDEGLPVMHVTAVTHRANPVLPAIVPAAAPSEEHCLSRLTERLLVPLVRLVIPEVVDLHLPAAGASRNLLFASFRKDFPKHGRKVMNALWSLRPLMTVKTIVVVDAHVDVQDERQVWHAVGANVHADRDLSITDGPADMADHASPVRGVGSKLGIDATAKSAAEGHPRNWPQALAAPPDIRQGVTDRWAVLGLSGPPIAVEEVGMAPTLQATASHDGPPLPHAPTHRREPVVSR
jgi:4-hydroxy-3-polyprenylbenzoate decarboxylase